MVAKTSVSTLYVGIQGEASASLIPTYKQAQVLQHAEGKETQKLRSETMFLLSSSWWHDSFGERKAPFLLTTAAMNFTLRCSITNKKLRLCCNIIFLWEME